VAGKKTIGVLALQGDFEAHQKALDRVGAAAVAVRTAAQLDQVDALIIPGGESSTMLKLLDRENLLDALSAFGQQKSVFGTCAGAILIATEVRNPVQRSLGLMDIAVERNAYGRQLDSHIASIHPDGFGVDLEAVFIRAPIIRRVGPEARVLAYHRNDPVLVEQGRHMAATFHPELTDDPRIHQMFLQKVK
jgi:pyridoxal 5'-phosphate synthase pdxT subunit